ncbi:MAG TPA: carboxypeptidase-like regulatory domain-containing protein, partial [Pyrinomonadaceae bacterium]
MNSTDRFSPQPLPKFFLFACCLLVVLASAGQAAAQEFRGSIAGTVNDSSGAAVPGATVTATNRATNTPQTTTTNEEGAYTLLYLTPGTYTLLVEATGFKRHLSQGVEVRVGDKLVLDLRLETGGVQETVTVTSDPTLLQTSTASAGQVIDRRRISELPLSDGNPFTLARLAAGATYTGELTFSRPFDNQGTSAIRADGAPGRNEFTLDGTPNMASGGGQNGVGRVAFVPPADAVQEFKVETASFDAQQGHTAGANVNVTLKNGTNDLHGTLYEFVRNDKLAANDFFLNRAGRPRTALRYNRYGATVGGPVLLPRFGEGGPGVWSGRDRTFFFFAFEGLKDTFPEPTQFTVPTLAQRGGDFSALLSQGIQIYDPLTAGCGAPLVPPPAGQTTCASGVRVVRAAFPGNIIPATRISQIARNYLQFYPLPNQQGDALGRNNFISGQPRTDDFHSESVRIDHTYTDKHKAFVRYTHNYRQEARSNWTGVLGGINPTGNFLFRINNGATYDHVWTATPTTIVNARFGFSRFWEPNIRQHQGEFDPASLGFSARTAAFFGDASHLPLLDFPDNTFSEIGNDMGAASSFNIYTFQPTVTKVFAAHSVRLGYDFRSYRENSYPATHAAGRYEFASNFTRERDNSPALFGQEFAAFLLGQPTGGVIDRNASRANQTLYHGLFIHDDWKATPKLT